MQSIAILSATNRTFVTQSRTLFGAALLVIFSAFHAQNAAVAQDLPNVADLVEDISNSVVNITTTATVEAPANIPNAPQGTPFDELFRDFMERNGPQGAPSTPRRSNALGSGFVISPDGFIVTNNHVIEGASEIEIEFFSGERLEAEIVGTDPKTDIALLKVDSDQPLDFVSFGSSDDMRVGDWVVAMGNPLGQGFSVSAGIVSARNRELSGSYDDYIQTDAAINRGNSGGPLFNMSGDVIGVNTAILSPTGGSIGIGFSMASDVVSKVVDQLKEFGQTRRGWLGVRIQDVTPDIAEALNLKEAAGAMVTTLPDGPASKAGILAGDIIIAFDGTPVEDSGDLTRRVGAADVGQNVPLTLLRNGDALTINVTLGRREEAELVAFPVEEKVAPKEQEVDKIGLTVMALTHETREAFGLSDADTGLVVTAVAQDSDAYTKGLRAGDVITEVSQTPVATPQEFTSMINAAMEAGRKTVLLLLNRDGEPRFIAVGIE